MKDTDRIIAYIEENRVLSLSTVRGSIPWATNCFYAFDADAMALLFLTELSTRHGGELCDNDAIAGTISSQEASVAKLRGIQFSGHARQLAGEALERGRQLYVGRFPVAALHPAPLWTITLDLVKYTNNTVGFGTKLYWRRQA
ncbi:pyridoxamine 5'-phosphate oxidase family protein [Consotaella aegiceratis]|uniref:pyridoxamine 5'-phosphate oxidase family protein n=1 Tax=Consotaella aegiceratis TaxID=3097961 RepID=UPI002F4054CB